MPGQRGQERIMKIGIGRKQLVVSLVNVTPEARSAALQIPAAIEADDLALARLNAGQFSELDRPRWESNWLLYGGTRARRA
jgi:hypothetical protein